MAKKKESKSSKAKVPGKKAGARPPVREPEAETAAMRATAAAPESAAREPRGRDPRLPPPGTVIEKCGRQDEVRCKCTVEEGGVRYNGKLYRSLSAAAMVAAKDLGLGGKTFNGYTWWGLSKPPRPAGDPLEALGRAWERYHARASAVAGGAQDDAREAVRGALEKHAKALGNLAESLT